MSGDSGDRTDVSAVRSTLKGLSLRQLVGSTVPKHRPGAGGSAQT